MLFCAISGPEVAPPALAAFLGRKNFGVEELIHASLWLACYAFGDDINAIAQKVRSVFTLISF
jgi:hypothetical protein